jgi:hypothetical protein
MTAVPTFAVLLLLEPLFCLTAKGIMPILCIWATLARERISVEAAVFLSAGPAPRLSASLAHVELVLVIKPTRKHIVAGGIL